MSSKQPAARIAPAEADGSTRGCGPGQAARAARARPAAERCLRVRAAVPPASAVPPAAPSKHAAPVQRQALRLLLPLMTMTLCAAPVPALGTPAPAPQPSQAAAPAAVPPSLAAESAATQHGANFEITAPVRQQLQRIQAQWLRWVSAADREHSDAAVGEMLATAGQLGVARLPDLSLGALAWAMEAARRRDFVRAGWSLAAAERLDPQRPETAFAEAAAARAAGSYARAAAAVGRAFPRLLLLPAERYLWLQDLVIYGLYLLLLTGGLFVAALMATRGSGLFRDLSTLFGRRLPGAAAAVLAAAALLWPLALPAGLAWVLLLWSLLLWGYASSSQRALLIGLWLLLGAAPLLIEVEKRAVAVRLSPPVKALENLRQRRLYGGLFADLGQLRSSLPDSPAVKHLLADVHRSLGQWEQARELYHEVLAAEPQNASALLNLGVYAFNRGDASGAVQYFQQAAAADPRNAAAAWYDLSQAYNESYLFDEARAALAKAKTIDAERVDRWLSGADQERVVAASGGLALIPGIERSLTGPAAPFDLIRYGASLAVALATLLLAAAVHLARRPYGYAEAGTRWRLGHRPADRWRRALLPGLASAEAGDGTRAFLALLAPVGLLLLPAFERLGYRIPWGYDAGSLPAWTISILGLALYLAVRLRVESRNAL